MYEKIWESHLVREVPGEPSLIYIDRHLVHEGTSPQAFAGIEAAGRKVRRPDLTFAVMDHSVPTITKDRFLPIVDPDAAGQFAALERNCKETGNNRQCADGQAGNADRDSGFHFASCCSAYRLSAHSPTRGTRADPLCVGNVPDGKVFSLISSLPSSLSANDVPSLFE